MGYRALTLPFLIGALLAFSLPADAHGNSRGTAKVVVGGKTVEVDYGRPSLNGRDMLARAEVGKDWRMGADAPTTLKTTGTLSFGTVQVPPGEYVLKAGKVSETDWVLKFVKDGRSVAEVPLQTSTLDKPAEMLTIDLVEERGQGLFRMSWGQKALSARFTAR
jgi:DUF2911 family protein